MSKTSRARDALKYPDRTESARETTAARFRVRALEAEQAAPASHYGAVADAGHALFVHIVDIQHLKNVERRHGNKAIEERRARKNALRAFQQWRLTSKIRRYASPVLEAIGDRYLRMSNGMRRLTPASVPTGMRLKTGLAWPSLASVEGAAS